VISAIAIPTALQQSEVMDIVFNHSVGLTALRNGAPLRLRFGCQEKVANVTDPEPHETLSVDHRSHRDLVLADGTVLKSVPVTAFRVEHSFIVNEATRSNAKTKTSASK
jgi:hypothetical protein